MSDTQMILDNAMQTLNQFEQNFATATQQWTARLKTKVDDAMVKYACEHQRHEQNKDEMEQLKAKKDANVAAAMASMVDADGNPIVLKNQKEAKSAIGQLLMAKGNVNYEAHERYCDLSQQNYKRGQRYSDAERDLKFEIVHLYAFERRVAEMTSRIKYLRTVIASNDQALHNSLYVRLMTTFDTDCLEQIDFQKLFLSSVNVRLAKKAKEHNDHRYFDFDIGFNSIWFKMRNKTDLDKALCKDAKLLPLLLINDQVDWEEEVKGAWQLASQANPLKKHQKAFERASKKFAQAVREKFAKVPVELRRLATVSEKDLQKLMSFEHNQNANNNNNNSNNQSLRHQPY